MLGLGEVGVPPHQKRAEAGLAAEEDGPVDEAGGQFMRGAVAAAIDQVQRLLGVGQRDQQGMIAPGAVVGDIDALFALGVGADEGAVDVDESLVKEVDRLLQAPTRLRVRLMASMRSRTSHRRNRRTEDHPWWWGRGFALHPGR